MGKIKRLPVGSQRCLVRGAWLCALALAVAGCPQSAVHPNTLVTAANHVRFPITAGPHAVSCNTCHGDFQTFAQFTCFSCHGHEQLLTDQLHRSLVPGSGGKLPDGGSGYAYDSTSCLACHATGAKVAFDHVGITATCASCHDAGKPFVALPVNGVGLDGGVFAHVPITPGSDCRACHTTTSWSGAAGAPDGVRDPARDVVVNAQIPTYSGSSIANLTAQVETLPMPMKHSSTALPTGALSTCVNCHADANAGVFFPGRLHTALASLKLTQPVLCLGCHLTSAPSGLVGPMATSSARTPPSGEMKHDAVVWSNGAPTATAAIPQSCESCHASPTLAAPTWATAVPMHKSLNAAQPTSCLDCHANSRPAVLLTAANAALPANLQFDHSVAESLGDCSSCHLNGGANPNPWTSWVGGQLHLKGSATLSTCLPCHGGERPTSTSGWVSTAYANAPFDYLPNSSGVGHGAGQDCAACHTGPGTGVWGGTPKQNWAGGYFTHGAGTTSATTCIACHMTQRPDIVLGQAAAANLLPGNFDHAINGTGDCFGCHQATVVANAYVNYFNPSTQTLPKGDWKDGVTYPGSTLISAPTQFITATETKLNRSSPNNLVTSTSSLTVTLYNAMLHTSTAVPAPVSPGLSKTGDTTTCWHCHTSTNTTVTSFANGQFHAALANFRTTPASAVTPLLQPTSQCTDCHAQMRPTGIVQLAGSDLQPMDHNATFVSAPGVNQIDCSTCHKSAGIKWADGVFHAKVGAAIPQDCTVCHYPMMADAPNADVTSAPNYAMRHRSGQITFQNCQTCHTAALSKGAGTLPVPALWRPGAYHGSVSSQPLACTDCHTVSKPAASTQSSWVYSLPAGSTPSNQAQWMNHASSGVVGKDCAGCHAADAKSSGSAWNKADSFHASVASSATCKECHGLGNGGGTVPGTNNNLPAGLTDSSMLTTASGNASTGVPSGTHDQITHGDVNATSHDCNFCHTQAGISTAPGVQGKEWGQASFHTSFTAANPLALNGTTGRCSDCHMTVKPTPAFTAFDHSALTSAPGTQDCASCHSWPGTGTASSPNWLGASAAPQFIPVGGFAIPQPPDRTGAPTTVPGIGNLPHPSTGGQACTACHTSPSGGKPATGYDHASALINNNCRACHEAGSNLVGTAWNGVTNEASGAGDTRPFTLSSIYAAYSGNSRIVTYPSHFFDSTPNASKPTIVDCKECHVVPTGNGTTTTGSAYLRIGSGGSTSTGAWAFPHRQGNMTDPTTCAMCHGNNIPR